MTVLTGPHSSNKMAAVAGLPDDVAPYLTSRRRWRSSCATAGSPRSPSYATPLGAALARAEAQITLTGLFERFPDLTLAGEVGWQPGLGRVLTGLPVRP
ncbi:cytochrome P450 [Nonomuraea diastatica]|uniref:cytochrome P450 n=1 Tax=Nonomuraea diastatica TaxID=1848329 RepID=UPI001FE5BB53|nr:cytochrome P450 [Nonomuraea diastatica]